MTPEEFQAIADEFWEVADVLCDETGGDIMTMGQTYKETPYLMILARKDKARALAQNLDRIQELKVIPLYFKGEDGEEGEQ